MKEWPLVIFTLAIQLASGLTLAATVFDAAPVRPLAVAVFPVAALGILASLAHLGRPAMAWRAFVNVRRSPLSREVLATAVFALTALAYSGFWWFGITQGRLALGLVASAAGVAAVVAAAAVYAIPARPDWKPGWVTASFLGTAMLLGGLAPAMLIPCRLCLCAAVAGSGLLLAAARCLLPRKPLPLASHLALACVLPAIMGTVTITPEFPSPLLRAVAFVAVLFGAAVGRAMMLARRDPF